MLLLLVRFKNLIKFLIASIWASAFASRYFVLRYALRVLFNFLFKVFLRAILDLNLHNSLLWSSPTNKTRQTILIMWSKNTHKMSESYLLNHNEFSQFYEKLFQLFEEYIHYGWNTFEEWLDQCNGQAFYTNLFCFCLSGKWQLSVFSKLICCFLKTTTF